MRVEEGENGEFGIKRRVKEFRRKLNRVELKVKIKKEWEELEGVEKNNKENEERRPMEER